MNQPTLPPFTEPLSARLSRLVWKALGKSPELNAYLTSRLTHRQFVPRHDAEHLIPEFQESEVAVSSFPLGPWATPCNDTLTLLKAIAGFKSKRILEIGSYHGTTARLMARNCPPDGRVFPLDMNPDHGSAYRGKPEEQKITRIIGQSILENVKPHAPFDFIFIDGDHSRAGAYADSLIALETLSEDGVIFWHDYNNPHYLAHRNGSVNEAVDVLKREHGIPIVAINGTMLAFYSRHPGWETAKLP